ncbi:MAG: gluconate 2-dehydrogenase subunit 3 family protein [bacterium]
MTQRFNTPVTATRHTRRAFVVNVGKTAAASALALHLPLLTTLIGCAGDEETFAHLTSAEARTMRAFAAQILPSEAGSPGADEARVVNFVDRAFGDPFFADAVPVVRAGLAELDTKARAVGERHGFSALQSAEQTAIMRLMSASAFFEAARTLVLTGAFSDSSYGGNYDGAGFTIMGMEHRASYAAPFGFYDAQTLAERTESAQ